MKGLHSILTAALCFIFSVINANDGTNPEGAKIFSNRCASCHNVNKQLTGPALANVHERRSLDWIVQFVHSPGNMIKKGDRDAVALYNQFNQVLMPDHADLTKEQVSNIIDFIKAETKIAAPDKAPFQRPGKLQPSYKPLSIQNTEYIIAYLFAVTLLVGVLLFAVRVKDLERKINSGNKKTG
jgi:cytochrome c2